MYISRKFISADRSGGAVGTIFPPCSKPTLRMRIQSTASFAEKEPTRAFQNAQAFHPVVVCFNMTPGSFITAVRRMHMLSLSHSPPASVWRGSRVADMSSP